MNKKTLCAAASVIAVAGMCLASSNGLFVTFETGAVPTGRDDCDAPDICVPGQWTRIEIPGDCTYINGELEKREAPGCEPDTYLVCFDKQNEIIAEDDNSSTLGNGWASALWGSDCFVDNLDGTRSLRLGVTGRPDGLDGVFNGLFQNGPHGQLGCFIVNIEFFDDERSGNLISSESYEDEFQTGAEAFYINYEVPADATTVHINIDNTCGNVEVRCDVDFFKLTNLVPLCDYCIEQIGGIDCECRPTDAMLGWFDKKCTLILHEDEGGAVSGFAKLCAVADANGEINIAVTGKSDWNFNGLDDSYEDLATRALPECPEPKHGHGVAGCYTLKVFVVGVHDDSNGMPKEDGAGGDVAAMQNALNNGDLNMDGVTNTADLGILIGAFGWIAGN